MLRIVLLLSLVLGLQVYSQAQPWTKNLPDKNSKKELTFFDYQKAFNTYWEPYNIELGYYIDSNGVKQKARGWNQFKRWEYFWETQIDRKTGKFPTRLADDIYKEYIKSNKTSDNKYSGEWECLGTNSSDGGYAGIGRINCIAYHPSDNNTYWVGTPSGGLWVTRDNANTWEVLTDNNAVLGISDIVIPSDYETTKTIYIATGDRDQWINLSVGVLKSTDDGATWQETGLSFALDAHEMTTRLLLDPNDDKTIIAATTKGVYKTIDSGGTWNELLSSLSFIDMEYKPSDFNTLYGATLDGKIYYSSDGGKNWVLSHDDGNRIELAVTAADSERVYAVVVDDFSGLHGVYKSSNSGVTFNKIFSSLNLLSSSSGGIGLGGQGWYDLSIAASPMDADLLLVGGINTWRSENGGTTFSIVNHWSGPSVLTVHADKHMLSFRNNGDLFECNDGGVYISTNNGTSWTDKTNGITHSQMYRLGVSQHSDNQVVTGLQDNGTKNFNDNTWSDVLGGDGMECLIDYSKENIQYGCQQRGVLKRTTDNWKSAYSISPENAGTGAWVTPFVIDPVNPSTLYAGYAALWKTTNKGYSWEKISSFNISDYIRSVAIAPNNNNVLYVAGQEIIYKTIDGGESWTNITAGLPSNVITYISISNKNPEVLWVSLGSYDTHAVYQSNDGGSSWMNISEGLPEIPVNCVIQDTISSDVYLLYAGTEAGVFVKVGDQNWVAFNNGLPNVKIGEIEIYYDADDFTKSRLVAATYGRGLWKTPLLLSQIPEVELLAIDSVTENSVVAKAKITDINNNTIESGFIYSPFSGALIGDKYAKTTKTNPLVSNNEYSLKLTGLSNASYYYIKAYVRSIFGINYSQELTFVTSCGGSIATLPFVQEFSVDSLPACWETFDNYGTDMVWEFNNPAGIELNSSTGNNGIAAMNSAYYGEGKKQSADLNSVYFDFTNHPYVNLIFEHNAVLSGGAMAGLYVKTENSDPNWQLIEQWTDTVGTSESVSYFVQDVSEIVSGHSAVAFKWSFQSENAGFWAIDDLLIDTLHAVKVLVADEDSNPIANAEVSLGNLSLSTNFSGEVLFKSVSNTTFEYSISAEGYYKKSGNLSVNHDNYYLNEVLTHIPSSNANLADLTLDGNTIDDFSPETTYYTVSIFDNQKIPVVDAIVEDAHAKIGISQATYDSHTATVLVTAENNTKKRYYVNFDIEPAPTYSVTFTVLSADELPVSEAVVAFEGFTETTDDKGVAILNSITSVNKGVYSITKSGYFEYSDTLSVIDSDVSVEVILQATDINGILQADLEIYPNPVNDKLYFSLTHSTRPLKITVYNVLGNQVIDKYFNESSGFIDMKSLEPGIYLVRFFKDKFSISKKIIIK